MFLPGDLYLIVSDLQQHAQGTHIFVYSHLSNLHTDISRMICTGGWSAGHGGGEWARKCYRLLLLWWLSLTWRYPPPPPSSGQPEFWSVLPFAPSVRTVTGQTRKCSYILILYPPTHWSLQPFLVGELGWVKRGCFMAIWGLLYCYMDIWGPLYCYMDIWGPFILGVVVP